MHILVEYGSGELRGKRKVERCFKNGSILIDTVLRSLPVVCHCDVGECFLSSMAWSRS